MPDKNIIPNTLHETITGETIPQIQVINVTEKEKRICEQLSDIVELAIAGLSKDKS